MVVQILLRFLEGEPENLPDLSGRKLARGVALRVEWRWGHTPRRAPSGSGLFDSQRANLTFFNTL